MKTILKIYSILIVLVISSCEDVIDVEVQEAPERLTIEASLDWEKGTAGNEQTIKLSTSTPYFQTELNNAVTGATVRVTNDSNGAVFIFADQNNGEYFNGSFVPVLNQQYTLEVVYQGETYRATETMMPVTDITDLTQSTEDGFDDEALEVNVIFTDPADEDNYYLFSFQERGELLPVLEDLDDEFVDGNEISWWFEKEENDDDEEFVTGDIVDIEMYGISEDYHNYIRILIEQSEGAGLFSTTPVALRGNCINQDNPDNYANGYFRVTEVVRQSYTFE
ncbi:MAG: DUF4249 domain-containing protein [Bacteroidota bacterium]